MIPYVEMSTISKDVHKGDQFVKKKYPMWQLCDNAIFSILSIQSENSNLDLTIERQIYIEQIYYN